MLSSRILAVAGSLLASIPSIEGANRVPRSTSFAYALSQDFTATTPSNATIKKYKVWNIDLLNNKEASVINRIKDQGSVPVCYFSAGTWEPDRWDWLQPPADARGNGYGGDFPDEIWVDFNAPEVRDVMKKRIELAASIGCPAIEADNVDAYEEGTGLDVSKEASFSYITWLSDLTRSHGMDFGLKNSVALYTENYDVDSVADFAINEECAFNNECSDLQEFAKNKAVLHIEYLDDEWASDAKAKDTLCYNNFSSVLMAHTILTDYTPVKACCGTGYCGGSGSNVAGVASVTNVAQRDLSNGLVLWSSILWALVQML